MVYDLLIRNNADHTIKLNDASLAGGGQQTIPYSPPTTLIPPTQGVIIISEPLQAYHKYVSSSWAVQFRSGSLIWYCGYEGHPTIQVNILEEGAIQIGGRIIPALLPLGNILSDGDKALLAAANSMYVSVSSQGSLIANATDLTGASQISFQAVDPGFVLKVSGRYVRVGPGNTLVADASSPGAATVFTVSGTSDGGVVFTSVNDLLCCTMAADGTIVTAPTQPIVDVACEFVLRVTDAAHFAPAARPETFELTPCQEAWAGFLWQVTGGLFLALGLGPYATTGNVRTGLWGIIQSNARLSAAIAPVYSAALSNQGLLATATANFLYLCLSEGMLTPIVKMVLSQLGWYALGRAISKVMMLLLLPELEAVDLITSFTVWSAQTIQKAVDLHAACPGNEP